mmetsp:Transcript_4893/g.11912  ORF Transcript_4893/g.11912 Transcript_4893/m.11912 type:complete len:265 (+) Transcript_4893:2263-3057(+)
MRHSRHAPCTLSAGTRSRTVIVHWPLHGSSQNAYDMKRKPLSAAPDVSIGRPGASVERVPAGDSSSITTWPRSPCDVHSCTSTCCSLPVAVHVYVRECDGVAVLSVRLPSSVRGELSTLGASGAYGRHRGTSSHARPTSMLPKPAASEKRKPAPFVTHGYSVGTLMRLTAEYANRPCTSSHDSGTPSFSAHSSMSATPPLPIAADADAAPNLVPQSPCERPALPLRSADHSVLSPLVTRPIMAAHGSVHSATTPKRSRLPTAIV